MEAAERRAADQVGMRRNQMIEAKPDAAFLAETDSRNIVVRLCALEAVHDASSFPIVDRKSTMLVPVRHAIRDRPDRSATNYRFRVVR
jgi:hypothetical protein